MSVAEKNRKRRYVVAAVLLMLPVLLSLAGGNGGILSMLASLIGAGDDVAELSFRSSAMAESLGALFSSLAFVLLLKYAAERVVRSALWILVAAELYMALYWMLLFIMPAERPAVVEVMGSTALLVAVIMCCYAWSLMLGNAGLGARERSWMLFMLMPYILSFVAFYAPMWQRFVPDGGVALLPDSSPLYVPVALLFNLLRCIAVWIFVKSPLFVPGVGNVPAPERAYTPFNRYMLAVALSALFVVKALAWVYENMHLFYSL